MRTGRLRALIPLLVAGCANTGTLGPPEPVTPASLTDDYSLVHGLAVGAVTSDGVDEAHAAQVIRLDEAALLALVRSNERPDDAGDQRMAADAMRQLAEYSTLVAAGPAPH